MPRYSTRWTLQSVKKMEMWYNKIKARDVVCRIENAYDEKTFSPATDLIIVNLLFSLLCQERWKVADCYF